MFDDDNISPNYSSFVFLLGKLTRPWQGKKTLSTKSKKRNDQDNLEKLRCSTTQIQSQNVCHKKVNQ